MKSYKLFLWLVLVLSAALVACEPDIILVYVDPPIDLFEDATYTPTGDPEVELGFYIEQLYTPLQDGDGCPVIHGRQGGTWTMPAIRIRGIASLATIQCTLTTASGEKVGIVASKQNFFLGFDGWLEIQNYPVPVVHESPLEEESIEDLFGQEGQLECTVTDDAGRMDTETIQIVITGE